MDSKLREKLCQAVGETYSAIYYDVDVSDFGGEVDWAELVLDANRIDMFGHMDEETKAALEAMPWEERKAFANSCNYW